MENKETKSVSSVGRSEEKNSNDIQLQPRICLWCREVYLTNSQNTPNPDRVCDGRGSCGCRRCLCRVCRAEYNREIWEGVRGGM